MCCIPGLAGETQCQMQIYGYWNGKERDGVRGSGKVMEEQGLCGFEHSAC